MWRSFFLLLVVVVVATHKQWWQRPPPEQILMDWFEAKGGWLHPNVTLNLTENYGYGLWVKEGGGIQEGETMVRVPESLILSKASALESMKEKWGKHIVDQLSRSMSDLEVLALFLGLEEMKGSFSPLAPYVRLLLRRTQPSLLFTFGPTEVALLDDQLVASAAETRRQLYSVWRQNVRYPFEISWSAYQRYYSIASAHAVNIRASTMLVPMADMINHAPRETSQAFAAFHRRTAETGVEVLADRNTAGRQQLLEEYNKLDNSIYLASFGFVPDDNPYHCASLTAKQLPQFDDEGLRQLWQKVAPDWLSSGSICVLRDGKLLESLKDDIIVGYLALWSLNNNPAVRRTCIESYEDRDETEILSEVCYVMRTRASDADAIRRGAAVAEQELVIQRQRFLAESDLEVWDNPAVAVALHFQEEERKTLQDIIMILS